MKTLKRKLIKISLLTTIMILNTGCIFGLFGEESKTEFIRKTTNFQMNNPTIQTSKKIIPLECNDEEDSQNSCQKKPIEVQELKRKNVVTKTGGEIHKLKSIQGKNITIIERPTGYIFPQFKNKIVILEMFGQNCSHCIKEMPIMHKLRRKYRHKLEIIALQVEGKMTKHQANRLLKRHRIHYPIIAGQTATNLQYQIQSTYGWTGILPFIMVIKDGVTEFTYRGEVSYKEINKDIRSLLR